MNRMRVTVLLVGALLGLAMLATLALVALFKL